MIEATFATRGMARVKVEHLRWCTGGCPRDSWQGDHWPGRFVHLP